MPKGNGNGNGGGGEKSSGKSYGLTAVAIDRDKGSQNAIKWAIDNILQKGQTLILVHVKVKHNGMIFLNPVSLSCTAIVFSCIYIC